MHEDWYLSEHNTGYIFMGPPWGSNGTPRVEKETGRRNEKKKRSARAREGESARRRERERRSREVRRCGWKKEKTGIWYRRHCFRSAPFSLPFSPRSLTPAPVRPPATARRAAPAENYPLTTGCLPFKLLFHLSSVSLPAFFHT